MRISGNPSKRRKGPSRKELRKETKKLIKNKNRSVVRQTSQKQEVFSKRDQNDKKRRNENTEDTRNVSVEKKRRYEEDDEEFGDMKMEKLAKKNPALYELLNEEKNKNNDEEDDKMIKYYGKKLKIKDKKKVPKGFVEDGFEDLFNFLNEFEEKNPNEEDEEVFSEEDEDVSGTGEDEESEEDGESDSEDDLESDQDDVSVDDDEEESNLEDDESSEEDDEVFEDEEFHGFDDDEAAEEEKPSGEPKGKYVPPHLRKQPSTKSEEYLRLQRQINGHLNRLSDSNMEPIFQQLETFYQSNPRHDVTEILHNIITNNILGPTLMLDAFVLNYSTLISLLYHTIGIDIGASLVQLLVEKFETEWSSLPPSVTDDECISDKKCLNICSFLSHLFTLNVVSSIIIFDILNLIQSRLQESDMELILKILKLCGFQLRSEDPSGLKSFIQNIQEKFKSIPQSTRAKFLMESINDIKNNKKKRIFDDSMIMTMLKFIRNTVKNRSSTLSEPLRVSLEDIHQIQTKGKWWLVGASWAGNEAKPDDTYKAIHNQATEKLMEKARMMGMNTDVRKSIFVILMSSEDFVDAFDRFLKLNLKDKQQRDIIRVILRCCGNEKIFNPYYAHLSLRFCQQNHAFKITFQYSFWDFFKELSTEKVILRRISNMAKLLAFLFGNGGLSLSILKTIAFERLDKQTLLFLQILFVQFFTKHSHDSISKAFKNVSAIRDLLDLREGIAYFLTKFMGQELSVPVSDPALLSKNVRMVKKIIETGEAALFQ
ncbi:hypothetical protein ROZALSC1DRAFT_29466 [Rozella allomycis CSF55]|uniref:Initiation factor eIF-4 gamma, MA3 domain-containing protein n=1 Tax=Rozella allomycis (strain CSF55) TaxID=988480 RepID=A0A075AXY8_ROZAC|nr:Initiation factor eIF-4 gamma, MA3 domain-containing protein [Rozella allomycis CSF55]RKP18886.1 hypothetical protein ROZALSC1DRAFT_29466 [Rozella allomycis CSF55]|eukprot:EPZ35014.1 Initiation factor eIF-4 gamma, MA3 domain-containing protein [Rozella allomycis CSF55]